MKIVVTKIPETCEECFFKGICDKQKDEYDRCLHLTELESELEEVEYKKQWQEYLDETSHA